MFKCDFEWISRFVAAAEFEKRELGGGMNSTVVGEFNARQKGNPISQGRRYIVTDHDFQGLISAFSLAIALGMMSSGHTKRCTETFHEGGPEG